MPGRMSSVPALPFLSRIAHTTPAQADRPAGFRSPQFSKRCRKKSLPENWLPRKGCQQPDLACARGAPFVRQPHARKAFAAPFSPPPGGSCGRRDKPKPGLILDAAPAQRRRSRKEAKKGNFHMIETNKAQLIGFLGADPERKESNGNSYAVLSVATATSWKKPNSEEW